MPTSNAANRAFWASMGSGEEAVQEPRHRRQVLAQCALPGEEREPGGSLEAFEGPALDVAPGKREVEQPKRGLGVDALQVVLGPEQAAGLRLALAAGDGAQEVEPSGDGADEAPLAADVGGDGAGRSDRTGVEASRGRKEGRRSGAAPSMERPRWRTFDGNTECAELRGAARIRSNDAPKQRTPHGRPEP